MILGYPHFEKDPCIRSVFVVSPFLAVYIVLGIPMTAVASCCISKIFQDYIMLFTHYALKIVLVILPVKPSWVKIAGLLLVVHPPLV